MKLKNLVFIFSFVSILFASCASTTPKDEKETTVQEPKESEEAVELKSGYTKNEILDWQYKGFGKDIPEWVQTFYNNGLAEVKKLYSEYDKDNILVFHTYAETLDQAEALFNLCLTKPDGQTETTAEVLKEGEKFSSFASEFVFPEALTNYFVLNDDIFLVKERSWVLLKEIFYDCDGNLENESVSYRTLAILVREDTGL